ncbi:MAG: DNA/RNA non-specific endonuclease, partial [Chloroflexi bacterium]|nr:DNA/RNA non-specific endonuclease [Chloroflexota bacterium]
MNLVRSFFFLVFVLLSRGSCPAGQLRADNLAMGIPASGDQVVERTGFALGYRETHEQAAWVSYCLTAVEVQSKVGHRRENFSPDPGIATGSATLADYRGSGFDRGHLAPAADLAWSQRAVDESFLLSNMSPQLPAFNRGVWKELEEQVRSFAVQAGSLWVVTGPVLEPGLPTIGANRVSVPRAYYKALLAMAPRPRALGFLLPNAASEATLSSFAVSVDQLERRTGLDFFSALPDSLERRLEKGVALADWNFGPAVASAGTGEARLAAAIQCRGLTKQGLRCKRLTRLPAGFCRQH